MKTEEWSKKGKLMKALIKRYHTLWTLPEEPIGGLSPNVKGRAPSTSSLPRGSKGELPMDVLWVPCHHFQGQPYKLGLSFLCTRDHICTTLH